MHNIQPTDLICSYTSLVSLCMQCCRELEGGREGGERDVERRVGGREESERCGEESGRCGEEGETEGGEHCSFLMMTLMYQKSLIDRYQHRPQELNSMCLAEFSATYVTNYQRDDSECDALPASDSDTTSTQIQLTGRFGKMNKRKREAVIRFRRYNKDAEPSNWYRAKLMLYYPWYDEHADLLGEYDTYEEHYTHVKSVVLANESKINMMLRM